MWKNLSFSLKVSTLVSVLIIFTIITGLGYQLMANGIRDIGIKQSSDTMLSGYKSELKDIVDVMAQSLSSAIQDMDNEQNIHKTFENLIQDTRFFPDKSGYFFIYKMGGEVFSHAEKPQLKGSNLFDLKDANGKLLIQELEKVAQKGGGFVKYLWDKPGRGNQPKLSYCRMIPGQPYWIGTGVYIDDIQKQEKKILGIINNFSNDYLTKLFSALVAILLLVIIPLTLIMIKSMVSPLSKLTEAASRFSKGKVINNELIDTERKDEIGQLSRAVSRLGRSTQIAIRKVSEMGQ